ncbi:MAG TPA: universal stress protein [Gaiellaceae bacterium]|nr:universal stress protein [Gaiellaceae bacterium]
MSTLVGTPRLVGRVMAATDKPSTADRVSRWAASLAERFEAELVLLQVLMPGEPGITVLGRNQAAHVHLAAEELRRLAHHLAGERGRARIVVSTDPSTAIIDAANTEGADVLVIGNSGMRDRRELLRLSVANRVSHAAECTVVLVDTARTSGVRRRLGKLFGQAA